MTDEENIASAEKYLSSIREREKAIKAKELELEALRYKASGAGAIDYAKDRVQTSPQNYMELAMMDIIEISAEVEEDKASIEETKGTAYSICRAITDPEQRAVIEWYYLNVVNMSDLVTRMNRSERSLYYLRDDALLSFGKLLNK